MVEEASPSLPPRKGSAHRSGRALWRGEELEGLSCALRSRSRLIVLSRGRLWHRPRRHHGLFKITGDAGAPRRFRTGGILKDHHPVHGAAPRAYGPSNKAFTQGHGVVPIPSMPQCRRRAAILGGRPRNREAGERVRCQHLGPLVAVIPRRIASREDMRKAVFKAIL